MGVRVFVCECVLCVVRVLYVSVFYVWCVFVYMYFICDVSV